MSRYSAVGQICIIETLPINLNTAYCIFELLSINWTISNQFFYVVLWFCEWKCEYLLFFWYNKLNHCCNYGSFFIMDSSAYYFISKTDEKMRKMWDEKMRKMWEISIVVKLLVLSDQQCKRYLNNYNIRQKKQQIVAFEWLKTIKRLPLMLEKWQTI